MIVTQLERDGQRCEIEQFAAPLARHTTRARAAKIASVFFTQVQLSGAGPMQLRLPTGHRESRTVIPNCAALAVRLCIVDRETGAVWLMIETDAGLTVTGTREPIADDQDPRIEFDCVGELAPGETRTIVLKLASPVVRARMPSRELAALDFVPPARRPCGTGRTGWRRGRGSRCRSRR